MPQPEGSGEFKLFVYYNLRMTTRLSLSGNLS